MHDNDWKLFEPITINGLRIKNRLVMLPMGNGLQGCSGEVTQRLIDHYDAVARGGAGLICVQAAYVRNESSGNRLRIDSDAFLPGLNQLAEAIQSRGARAAIQLNHPGYLSGDGFTINDLRDHQIGALIDDFGKAAERARTAGFEMIEIHGGHGYLIAQFLSGLTNRRGDAYGGSFENRTVFGLEVYRRIRKTLGRTFPISFRLSVHEFLSGGITPEEANALALKVAAEGVDLISVTAGKGPETKEWSIQPMAFPRGCLTAYASTVKASVRAPVLVAGRINDPVLANEILEKGEADLIGMGRGLIADPEFPAKANAGRLDEIRKCIACNCCHGKRFIYGLPVRCAINPEAAAPTAPLPLLAERRKRVLIVGGGPSGLECAHTVVSRGHEALLFEEAAVLGGKLRVAALPPHKEEIREFLDFLIKRALREKVSVVLNHKVDAGTIREVNPDALVLAIGGRPLFPEVPGLREANCLTAEEALTRNLTGEEIIVLGAGLVGCETAEFLLAQGKKVTMIEQLPGAGMGLEPITRKVLLRRLNEEGALIRTSTEVVNVRKGEAFLRNRAGEESALRFDAIVVAAGYGAHEDVDRLSGVTAVETHTIGDCCNPRGLFEAVHEGYRAGCLI